MQRPSVPSEASPDCWAVAPHQPQSRCVHEAELDSVPTPETGRQSSPILAVGLMATSRPCGATARTLGLGEVTLTAGRSVVVAGVVDKEKRLRQILAVPSCRSEGGCLRSQMPLGLQRCGCGEPASVAALGP